MAVLYYESQLCHHGIRGQRWGIRRFQNPDGSLTAAGRRKYGRYGSTSMRLAKSGNRKLTTSKTREISKKIAVGTGVAAAVGAGLVGTTVAATIVHPAVAVVPPVARSIHKANRMSKERYTATHDFMKDDSDGMLEYVSSMAKLNKKEPVEQSLLSVRPGPPKLGSGCEFNCTSCSVALDMRQRGYDVRARRQNVGSTPLEIASLYKGAVVEHIPKAPKRTAQSTYDTVVNILKNVNNGNSSGCLGMTWGNLKSGHCIYYSSKNGNVELYDGQTKLYGARLDKYFALADPEGFDYIRTDHVKPVDNKMGYYVVSSKEDKLKKEDAE